MKVSFSLYEFCNPDSRVLLSNLTEIRIWNFAHLNMNIDQYERLPLLNTLVWGLRQYKEKVTEINLDLIFLDRLSQSDITILFTAFLNCSNLRVFSVAFSREAFFQLKSVNQNIGLICSFINLLSQRGVSISLRLKVNDVEDEVLDNDNLSQILTSIFSPSPNLQILDMSGNDLRNFSVNELNLFFDFLRHSTGIIELNLRGCGLHQLSSQNRLTLFQVIGTLPKLQVLNLSYNQCHHLPLSEAQLLFGSLSVSTVYLIDDLFSLEPKDIRNSFQILSLFPKIETFYMNWDMASVRTQDQALIDKRTAITQGLQQLRHLKTLSLHLSTSRPVSNAELQDSLNSIVEVLPRLRELDLSGNRLARHEEAIIVSLCIGVSKFTELEKLNLSRNELNSTTSGSLYAFIDALEQHCRKLSTLVLSSPGQDTIFFDLDASHLQKMHKWYVEVDERGLSAEAYTAITTANQEKRTRLSVISSLEQRFLAATDSFPCNPDVAESSSAAASRSELIPPSLLIGSISNNNNNNRAISDQSLRSGKMGSGRQY